MDDDRFYDNFVVVTSNHGDKYAGWLKVAPTGSIKEKHLKSDEDLMICASECNSPVVLYDARQLFSNVVPQPTKKGMTLSRMVLLVPIDSNSGPISELYVVPSSWYFPARIEGALGRFKSLLKQAEDQEGINRAADAGLTLPGIRGM